MEVKEIPLHYSPKKAAKAEAAAQNRLVHRLHLCQYFPAIASSLSLWPKCRFCSVGGAQTKPQLYKFCRRLLAEMEKKAGFKSKTTAQKAVGQNKVMMPLNCLPQDYGPKLVSHAARSQSDSSGDNYSCSPLNRY